MEYNFSFPKELNKVKENRIPTVICGGTVEYHGPHCSYSCDTLVAEGLIKKLAEKKEIMIAPTIYYSPSSYAVADETSGTVHIEEDVFEAYLYGIFMNMLQAGLRNIYVVIHHQFEQESLMPMTLSYMKAAKRATMRYLEATQGKGWWGSENYASYYEDLCITIQNEGLYNAYFFSLRKPHIYADFHTFFFAFFQYRYFF